MMALSGDEALAKVLRELRMEELAALEEEVRILPPHRFSRRFERRMNRLIRRTERGLKTGPSSVSGYIPARRLGLVVLAALLASIGLCMSVSGIRESFFELMEKAFDKYSDIRYENPVPQAHGGFVEYEIACLPEGYEVDKENTVVDYEGGINWKSYYNGKDYISLQQEYADQAKFMLNTEDAELIPLTIGVRAGHYLSNRGMETFIWVEDGYSFLVSCETDKEMLSDLVKSTKRKNIAEK